MFSAARSLLLSGLLSRAATSDEVTHLPGLRAAPCWKHSTGYLSVGSRGSNLFYWYHEAVKDPKERPLVLWLNGGPGCSSLGGMFTELGPFVVGADGNVTLNPYAWNSRVNLLFLEQPAGVGFSYPNAPANDTVTAQETYEALVAFLRLHKELRGRKFYVMGESYGGHYVPNTAAAILDGNARLGPASPDRIALVGFAVGNGYTDWHLDFNENVPNTRYHALTSQSRYEAAAAACAGDYARCFWPRKDVQCPAECDAAVQAAVTDAMDSSIDIYDIYEDVCLDQPSDAPQQAGAAVGTWARRERLKTQAFMLLEERHRARAAHAARRPPHRRELQTTISPIFPTCVDVSTAAYLNDPHVQKAIGIRPGTVPNGRWSDCGNVHYDFNYASELPNYRKWVAEAEGSLQILIYNGDADYILSHMGNAAWIERGLALNKSKEWTKWRGSDGQVAGYFEQWGTANPQRPLTFLTVKGAGHMVPKDRPRHALDMLGAFLDGKDAYDRVPRAPAAEPPPLCPA